MKKIFVLAGNVREYDHFRRKHEFSLVDMRYISDSWVLQGVDGPIVVTVGDWSIRKDIYIINDLIRSRRGCLITEREFEESLRLQKEVEDRQNAMISTAIEKKERQQMEKIMANEPTVNVKIDYVIDWKKLGREMHQNIVTGMNIIMRRDFNKEREREIECMRRKIEIESMKLPVGKDIAIFDAGIGASMPIGTAMQPAEKGSAVHIKLEKPQAVLGHTTEEVAVSAASAEKLSLKEAEDKIVAILNELNPSMQNLLYKILFNSGIRIESAESVVRQNFKI